MAGDIVRVIRSQEQRRFCDAVRTRYKAKWNSVDVVNAFLRRHYFFCHRCFVYAGRNGVAPYSLGSVLPCNRTRDRKDAGLCGVIVNSPTAEPWCDRCDINDVATALRLHRWQRQACAHERTSQGDCDGTVPGFKIYLFDRLLRIDPCIVYQDIKAIKLIEYGRN